MLEVRPNVLREINQIKFGSEMVKKTVKVSTNNSQQLGFNLRFTGCPDVFYKKAVLRDFQNSEENT